MASVWMKSSNTGFKKDAFYRVTGIIRSKIGPRTLVTRAEASWTNVGIDLVRKYGRRRRNTAPST